MAHYSSQARNYPEALQWYNYSLSFFKAGQLDPNLAKLQRNRASCFLQLKQLEKVRQDRPGQPGRQVFPSSLRCQLLIYASWIPVFCVCQAKDAVKEAQRCDPDSIFTHFSVYKVAVLENDVEGGIWGIVGGKSIHI